MRNLIGFFADSNSTELLAGVELYRVLDGLEPYRVLIRIELYRVLGRTLQGSTELVRPS